MIQKVKFWPRPEGIFTKKCDHRMGADNTSSIQTDTVVASSIDAFQCILAQENARGGAFVTQFYNAYTGNMLNRDQFGLIRHDIYFSTDFWKNPTTGTIELIPDYAGETWTTLGATAFGVTAGTTKGARTPNHGQQMWNVSTTSPGQPSKFGYDFVSGVKGQNNLNELSGVVLEQMRWFKSLIGRDCSIFSFRNGQAGAAGVLFPYNMGNRNSSTGSISLNLPAPTFYGEGLGQYTGTFTVRSWFNNFPITFRWWDWWNTNVPPYTREQADAYVIQEVLRTKGNKGLLTMFVHVHSAEANGTLPSLGEYAAMVNENFGENFVWWCSHGEAVEYAFIRDLCLRTTAITHENSVIVFADIEDKYKGQTISGVPTDSILSEFNVPLSIEVDLTGTVLEGKSIVSSFGKIRNLGSNRYIIQMPFRKTESIQSVVLTSGTGGYFAEQPPDASISLEGTTLLVSADMPVKVALFSTVKGAPMITVAPVAYSNGIAYNHTFEVDPAKDYYAILMSEFLQTSLKTFL